MTAPVRFAVVGCGRIGSMHAELLSRRVPGADVAVIHDAVPATAEDVGARLGLAVVADLEAAVGGADIDVVAICSSTDTHVDMIVAAAQAGKAIFCEKPISLDLGEVDRALGAVGAAGVPLHVGFNRRFDPSHQGVRDAVAAGRIGAPHLCRITSRDPVPPPIAYIEVSGGIFLDMTIHDFDMARFVVGSEVDEVYATGGVMVDPLIGQVGDIDTAVVVLRHANGAITTIDNSRQAVYGYDQRVEVFGSDGVAASENPLAHTGVVRTVSGAASAPLPYFFLERYTASYLGQWQAFVTALQAGEPMPITGADGRAPLVIGLAAWRSLRERRPVQVEEIESLPG